METNHSHPEDWILWQDKSLLVINKPAGLLTIPDGYDPSLPSVASLFRTLYGKIFIVHRLDKDTSGVLILALTAAAHRQLNDQFSSRQTEKVYHALCAGVPTWDHLLVDALLLKNGDRSHRTIIDAQRGKPAATDLTVMAGYPAAALIEARPHTGYTHQIRAHCAYAGFPLLIDALYRRPTAPPEPEGLPIRRIALHAHFISIQHPVTGERLSFSAPYPPDFSAAVEWLQQ